MAPHVNPFALLGGALRGTLPNPSLVVDEAGLVISGQVFGPRRPKPSEVRAGSNITVTPDAGGVTIAATGGGTAVDDASMVLAQKAFALHSPQQKRVKAGANITVTEDADGYNIAGTAGGAAVDDASNVLATAAFHRHPTKPPDEIQAGSNITITKNAAGSIIAAAFAGTGSLPLQKAGSDAGTTALSPASCPAVDTAFPTTPLLVTVTPATTGDYLCIAEIAVAADPVRLSVYVDGALWSGIYHSNNGAGNDVAWVTQRADPSSTVGQPFYKGGLTFVVQGLSPGTHTIELRYAAENNVNQRTFLQRWLAVMRMDGGTVDDAGVIDAARAYLPHPQAQKGVRAGAGITITQDAGGYVVALTPTVVTKDVEFRQLRRNRFLGLVAGNKGAALGARKDFL